MKKENSVSLFYVNSTCRFHNFVTKTAQVRLLGSYLKLSKGCFFGRLTGLVTSYVETAY